MEHPAALEAGGGLYRWHAGAPDDASYMAAHDELIRRLDERLADLDLAPLTVQDVTPEARPSSGVTPEYVAEAVGQALVEVAARRPDLVVLDGDLAADCRIRGFERAYPERFIENGIAEQDMVSMAGGLARLGLLPVVNTFASFLAARANEQIYNNAGERTKIIYAAHYAGLIPAGPGKSHQSIRDISLLGALPNCIIIQPCSGVEARLALEYCVDEAEENCVLRLVIGPSPRIIELPGDYRLQPGRGVTLRDGSDAVLFGYGPVMLHEALLAAELLAHHDFHLKVVNMPWLNRVDTEWLHDTIGRCPAVYVLEDHAPVGGLGDHLLSALVGARLLDGRHFQKLAVEGYPACGTPPEALRYHGLDGESLAARIGQRVAEPA
jgi:transketolase